MVVTVFGPVTVKALVEVILIASPAAAIAAVVPTGVAVQNIVEVAPKAGEIPLTEAVDGEAELSEALP